MMVVRVLAAQDRGKQRWRGHMWLVLCVCRHRFEARSQYRPSWVWCRKCSDAKGLEKLTEKSRSWSAEGLCRACGRDAVYGRKMCFEHLRYHRNLKREKRRGLK